MFQGEKVRTSVLKLLDAEYQAFARLLALKTNIDTISLSAYSFNASKKKAEAYLKILKNQKPEEFKKLSKQLTKLHELSTEVAATFDLSSRIYKGLFFGVIIAVCSSAILAALLIVLLTPYSIALAGAIVGGAFVAQMVRTLLAPVLMYSARIRRDKSHIVGPKDSEDNKDSIALSFSIKLMASITLLMAAAGVALVFPPAFAAIFSLGCGMVEVGVMGGVTWWSMNKLKTEEWALEREINLINNIERVPSSAPNTTEILLESTVPNQTTFGNSFFVNNAKLKNSPNNDNTSYTYTNEK